MLSKYFWFMILIQNGKQFKEFTYDLEDTLEEKRSPLIKVILTTNQYRGSL